MKFVNHSATILFLLLAFLFSSVPMETVAQQQTLTLHEAFLAAETHFSFDAEKKSVADQGQLAARSIRTQYYPQPSIHGRVSYQSDITSIDIPLPDIDIPEQERDQYRIEFEISQLLYDGGKIRALATKEELRSGLAITRAETFMLDIKKQVADLFIAVLLSDARRAELHLTEADLEAAHNKVTALAESGVVLNSEVKRIEADQILIDQNLLELQYDRRKAIKALTILTGKELDENIALQLPQSLSDADKDSTIDRPELDMIALERDLVLEERDLINTRLRPRLELFFSGGYGRPGLDLLDPEFQPYAIGGIRMLWQFGAFYQRKPQLEAIMLKQKDLGRDEERVTRNINLTIAQDTSDARKLSEMILDDDRVVEIRQEIKKAAEAKLELGVITVDEYLTELHAEEKARMAKAIHEILLKQAQLHYHLNIGNL